MTTPTGRTRLSPEQRRTQLLDLGVELLATRAVDDLSIDLLAEQAGISRGLLYHYFGSKGAFREAVVRRAVEDLVAQTAPPAGGDPITRLHASMGVYVDYVVANYAGYRSLVKAAAGGSAELQALYEEARAALTDRIFREGTADLLPDTPATRLVVRGWSAMSEELVLTWATDPHGTTREQLVELLVASLPALTGLVGRPAGTGPEGGPEGT